MKNVSLILCLLLCIGQGVVSDVTGTVAFDFPEAPVPIFQLNFDRELLALVTTDERFSAVETLFLRTYAAEADVFDAFVRYYGETLKANGWNTFAEAAGMHIYVLAASDLPGIFAIVKNDAEVSLLNIVGLPAENQHAAVLRNLHLLGIEIPALKSLKGQEAETEEVPTASQGSVGIATGSNPAQPAPPSRTFSYTLDGGIAGPGVRFNRVTGWELNAGFDYRLPGIPVSDDKQKPRIDGIVGYGFGNRLLSYDISLDVPTLLYSRKHVSAPGGTITRNMTLGLRLRAKVFRKTDVITPNIAIAQREDATNPFGLLYSLFGGADLHDYYLRNGFEIGLRWESGRRKGSMHGIMLTFLAETHESLPKSTDWHFLNWQSARKSRENPEITDGKMRSLVLQYDFNTRALKEGALASSVNHHLEDWQNPQSLQDAIMNGKLHHHGWHNTLLVEYSHPALRSDFDFTRYQLHLRYAHPLGNHHIRARAIGSFSTAALPIQRQFAIGGPGTLNGYPLYEFAGDRGILANVEYFYHLPSLFAGSGQPRAGFPIFLVPFFDVGQVWNASGENDASEPKGSAGIGLQFGEDNFILRGNLAKAFETAQGVQFNLIWFYSF